MSGDMISFYKMLDLLFSSQKYCRNSFRFPLCSLKCIYGCILCDSAGTMIVEINTYNKMYTGMKVRNLSLNHSPSIIFMKGFYKSQLCLNKMEIMAHIPCTVISNGECQPLNVHVSTL